MGEEEYSIVGAEPRVGKGEGASFFHVPVLAKKGSSSEMPFLLWPLQQSINGG